MAFVDGYGSRPTRGLADVRKGMCIDAQDETGQWYESTVLEVRGEEVHIHCVSGLSCVHTILLLLQ